MATRFLITSLLVVAMAVCCVCDTPQLAFMKSAREKLNNYRGSTAGIHKEIVQLGTSLPPTNSEGSNFTISVGSKIDLEFDFEEIALDRSLPSATLWLFPDSSSNDIEPEEKDVEFIVTVHCPEKQYGTEHHIVLKWNMAASCLSLDVTLPVKRLLKFLAQAEERYATLSVQVADISEHSSEVSEDGEAMCRTLESQSLDAPAPFLYLQFVELSNADISQDSRKHRSITVSQPSSGLNVENPCTRVELPVHLPSLNISVINPSIPIDIGLCMGGCEGEDDSLHKKLAKMAAENTEENYSMEIINKINEEKRCIPITYEPITVMLQLGRGFAIIQLVDAIVTSCGCQ